jgi:hypothetical protein
MSKAFLAIALLLLTGCSTQLVQEIPEPSEGCVISGNSCCLEGECTEALESCKVREISSFAGCSSTCEPIVECTALPPEEPTEDEAATDTTDNTSAESAATTEEAALLQVCPEQLISDQMPLVLDANTETTPTREYYIFEGTRHELTEFDADWVKTNCEIDELVTH